MDKHNCDNVNCNHNDTKGLCCLFNPDNCKYRQLQKENAELKEKLKPENCLKLLAKEGYIKFTSDNLSKAKEHIKKLLDCLKQDTNDPQTNYYVCQYMDKAEQFISEVEK